MAAIAGGVVFKNSQKSSPKEQKVIQKEEVKDLAENQVLEIVKNLPEVKEYLKNVPEAQIVVDHEENNMFVVQVFEVKDGHTATFNWYEIDKKTDKIKNLLPQE